MGAGRLTTEGISCTLSTSIALIGELHNPNGMIATVMAECYNDSSRYYGLGPVLAEFRYAVLLCMIVSDLKSEFIGIPLTMHVEFVMSFVISIPGPGNSVSRPAHLHNFKDIFSDRGVLMPESLYRCYPQGRPDVNCPLVKESF
eukprot:Gb_19515 [translate_table: standard]